MGRWWMIRVWLLTILLLLPQQILAATDDEGEREVRVAVVPGAAPFQYFDGVAVQGLAVDYLSVIGENTGLTFHYVHFQDWDEFVEGIDSGEVDLIPVAARGAAASLSFSKPWGVFPVVINFREGTEAERGLHALGGKRIAVHGRSMLTDVVRRYAPDAIVVEMDSARECMDQLMAGGVGYWVTNIVTANHAIKTRHAGNIRMRIPPEYEMAEFSFAVPAGGEELLTHIEAAFEEIDPSIARSIRDRWLIEGLAPEVLPFENFWRYLLGGAAIVLLMAGWVLVVQWQKHALRESEERFRNLVSNITDLFYVLDERARFIEVNRAALRRLGYKREELLRLSPFEVDPNFDVIGLSELERRHGLRVPFTFNSFQQTHKGELFPVEVRGVFNRRGGSTHLYALARDVSERHEVEAALRAAKEGAEAASEAKTNFLAVMSHELRTPLNAILGYSQLMAERGERDEEDREHLDIINRSGSHLLSLINDVLEMSRIEAGRVVLQESDFSLRQLLEDVEDLFRLRAGEKGIALRFLVSRDVPGDIRGDEGKLRQVIVNLVGNAIKFTGEGEVRVHVRADPPEAEGERRPTTLHFEIVDSGAGIREEELREIFEPFSQSDSGLHSRQGTGLGLPISRYFVELMGGTLTLESARNVGTTARFAIPARPAGEAEEAAEWEAKPARARPAGWAGGLRMLVVDDVAVNAMLLRKILEQRGHQVRVAANGEEAVAEWEEWRPHLIWMDMRMPVMDGYEATRIIKGRPGGAETRIVALTASAFEEQRDLILGSGCDEYIRKPFRIEQIIECIERQLG